MVLLSDPDLKPQKSQTFPGSRIKVAEQEKMTKMNMSKQDYCDLHRNWTILNDSVWVLPVSMDIFE